MSAMDEEQQPRIVICSRCGYHFVPVGLPPQACEVCSLFGTDTRARELERSQRAGEAGGVDDTGRVASIGGGVGSRARMRELRLAVVA